MFDLQNHNTGISTHTNPALQLNSYNSSLYNSLWGVSYSSGVNLESSNFLNIVLDWLSSSLIVFWCIIIVVLYYAAWGLQMLSFNLNGSESFSDAFSYLSEIDDEIGPLDDIIHYSVIFGLVAIWFFTFTIFFMFFSKTLVWTFTIIQFLLAVLIILPFSLFYSFGFSFVTFLRGSSRTSAVLIETGYDFLSVMSMLVRYMVQHLRFVFIFIAFFDLFELVYTSLDFSAINIVSQIFSFKSSNSEIFFTNYWYDWFGDLINSHLILFYYALHLTYSFIVQLTNYLALTVFLVCFLYTGFLGDTYESYFRNMRVAN